MSVSLYIWNIETGRADWIKYISRRRRLHFDWILINQKGLLAIAVFRRSLLDTWIYSDSNRQTTASRLHHRSCVSMNGSKTKTTLPTLLSRFRFLSSTPMGCKAYNMWFSQHMASDSSFFPFALFTLLANAIQFTFLLIAPNTIDLSWFGARVTFRGAFEPFASSAVAVSADDVSAQCANPA